GYRAPLPPRLARPSRDIRESDRDFAGTVYGGGGGIRTHGTVARTRHFQCRTFGHSATPPSNRVLLAAFYTYGHLATYRCCRLHSVREKWRSGEDLNPRGTHAPIRFRVGRLQPGSATPPCLTLSRTYRASRLFGSSFRTASQVYPSGHQTGSEGMDGDARFRA